MSIATELQADHEEVCRAAAEKRPISPDVSRRVRERAEAIRAELRRRNIPEVAVGLIREARDE